MEPAGPIRRPIAELQPGERVVDAIYRIVQKDLRSSNSGSYYIHAVIADRTGQLVARMWNASPALFESLPENGLAYVCGRVESYKGRLQLIMEAVRCVEPGVCDPSDFLPASRYDVEQMWERTKEILRRIENPHLLALVGKFVRDERFAAAFKRSPAARQNHHAWLGGLLEHTLNLLELALLVLPRYPRVNRDLVLAGIFLHDAGKTAELTSDVSFDYTTEGQLLGHIVQAVTWVDAKAREVQAERGPFPPELLAALKHIILAHHGRHEFGSPRLPATAEAFMVHYLDNLDARLAMVFQAIDSDPDAAGEWTAWVPALETRVFKSTTAASPDDA